MDSRPADPSSHPTEMRVTVRVRPGASRTKVGGSYGDPAALIVAVSAPAVDGRANDAVIDAIAVAFEVRSRDVRMVSGMTARSKVLAITSADPASITDRLVALLAGD